MLHIVTTDKPLDRVCDDLQEAITRRSFGVVAVHDLQKTMASKGVAEEVERVLLDSMDEAAG